MQTDSGRRLRCVFRGPRLRVLRHWVEILRHWVGVLESRSELLGSRLWFGVIGLHLRTPLVPLILPHVLPCKLPAHQLHHKEAQTSKQCTQPLSLV